MRNMMKEYLGNEYTNNHLKNFCLYWMKASKGSGDEWRKKNDLDCLYFDGDLRADTLMSAWTPVKWVADCLNREYGLRFYKKADKEKDSHYYLRLLAEDREAYLTPEHELVRLLDRFLELAEKRCNYILLPDRRMNPDRYNAYIHGQKVRLFDEVPATLYHLFEKDGLGKYFLNESGEVNTEAVVLWIKREHLEMGFAKDEINQNHVLPLISGLHPGEAKWLADESEIKEALTYMIHFLEKRQMELEEKSI